MFRTESATMLTKMTQRERLIREFPTQFVTLMRLVALCVVLIFPKLAHTQNQTLRGRVVDAASQEPLRGALVQVRDRRGDVVTTTTTSESGNYAVTTLLPDTYSIRILRIGHRPFEAGSVAVTATTPGTLNVNWRSNPIPLATRLVRAERACKISPDSGTLIANVWEEARKALLSSNIAEQANAPEIERVNFERHVNVRGHVLRQSLAELKSRSFRAYSSWYPESLAAHGYVTGTGAGMTFVGPDANTLLSDGFAGTHCFELTNGVAKHANDIGLKFTAVASTDPNRVDISGTFWVDEKSWALRSVDYRYEGGLLKGEERYAGSLRAGGLVEFGSLASGEWLVTNWRIGRPVFDPVVRFGVRGGMVASASKDLVDGVDESGGFITKISQNGATTLERAAPTVSLRVFSNDSLVSIEGAQVRIRGIDSVFSADNNGMVKIRGLFDGLYVATAKFPSVESFGASDVTKNVLVDRLDVRDSIAAPTVASIIRKGCGPKADFKKRSALWGVFSVDGKPRPGTTLIFETPSEPGATSGTALRIAATNANGYFVACDLPRETIVIRPTTDVTRNGYKFTLNGGAEVQYVAPDIPSAVATRTILETATVEVQLFDVRGNPISAKLDYLSGSAKPKTLTTDKFGRALLQGEEVGTMRFMIGKDKFQDLTLIQGYNLVRIVLTER